MKKQAVVLALFLLIASQTPGSVSAATAPVLSASAKRASDGVSVTCRHETTVDHILCAVYGKDGALLALNALNPDKETQTARISCDAAQADRVKLFAMDAARRPVGPVLALTLDPLPSDVPAFAPGAPTIAPAETNVEMFLRLSGPGTAFFVVAPADAIPTRDLDGRAIDWTVKDEIPAAGNDVRRDSQGNEVRDENGNPIPLAPFYVSVPSCQEIIDPHYADANVRTGRVSDGVTVVAGDLLPGTNYFVYFALRGAEGNDSAYAQMFRFTTSGTAPEPEPEAEPEPDAKESASAVPSSDALHMDLLDGRVGDTCSGRVSLTFNEYPYCRDNSTTPPTLYPLDRGPISSPLRELPENRNFRSVASLVQSRSSERISIVEDDESQVGKPTLTFEVQLDHAENGTFLTFSPNLCDQYGNARAALLTLSVRIAKLTTQVDVDDKGDPVYGFVSTPILEITPAWDGRRDASRETQ